MSSVTITNSSTEVAPVRRGKSLMQCSEYFRGMFGAAVLTTKPPTVHVLLLQRYFTKTVLETGRPR